MKYTRLVSSPCPRPGCKFPRNFKTDGLGDLKIQPNCSFACTVWLRRAKAALRGDHPNPGEEAAELLRLSDLLDARKTPREHIQGIERQRAA